MKTNISSNSSESGTALLVTLFLCLILSVSIAGYLRHSSQQNMLSMRSQTWNMTIAVSEAGVEEAMQHLNTSPDNLAADGWSKSGTIYSVTRELTPAARYRVSIDSANPERPLITSQAFINEPGAGFVRSPLLAAIGVTVGEPTGTSIQQNTITRVVRVTAGRSGLFLKAMVAKHTIDMNGQNVTTDSFNSADPNFSDKGMYPTNVAKRLDNGDVASNDSLLNAVNAGIANIYGRVAVGPKGTVNVGPLGGVGTRSWQTANPGTIQPGYFSDDMNFTFPSITLPYTAGLSPKRNQTVVTTNYSISTTASEVTTSTYPSPEPPGGVQTNMTYVTTSALPYPIPYGSTTNILTKPVTSETYPAPGTYVGTVSKKGKYWVYDAITGINYRYPTYTYTYDFVTTTTNVVVSSQTYDYVIEGGAANMPPLQYIVDEINGGKVLVTGNAQLVVRNNYRQVAQDVLLISPDGKLEMWVGGTSLDLSGNGVMNENGYAQNFLCWCADSVTDFKLAGNGEFTGIVVAPNANATLNGGGVGVEDFIGSIIANTIRLNGHYRFHYDEALRNLRNNSRYMVTQWNEVPPSYTGFTLLQ